MILDIHDPVVGAYVVDFEQLKRINDESYEREWGARWSDEKTLTEAVDKTAQSVLVPLLKNSGSSESYRCYLWHLVPNSDERRCVLIDVSAKVVSSLSRMEQRALEGLVALLMSELDLSATK